MTRKETFPSVDSLSCAAIDAKPRDYDFDAKAHADYSDNEAGWRLAIEPTEAELDSDPDAWCPLMSYAYPLPGWGDHISHAPDAPVDARKAFERLPLTIVEIDGETYLALTGGGMDLSWEICEGYMRLGYLPPAHFCDLPAMAGRGTSPRDKWIVAGCKRSLKVLGGWLARRSDSLDKLVINARREERQRNAEATAKAKVRFGFEIRDEQGWNAHGVGFQGPSNYFDTREEAEAELQNLARVLECDVKDLRVVEVAS